jgi:hypothetical protein
MAMGRVGSGLCQTRGPARLSKLLARPTRSLPPGLKLLAQPAHDISQASPPELLHSQLFFFD